jgi:hypothetical protein
MTIRSNMATAAAVLTTLAQSKCVSQVSSVRIASYM